MTLKKHFHLLVFALDNLDFFASGIELLKVCVPATCQYLSYVTKCQ